jgi:hypothetical protein
MDTNAPMAELMLGAALRRYERVKLTLLVIVLCLNIGIGSYLIGISNATKRSSTDTAAGLVILRCAVAKDVRTKPDGTPRTATDSSARFDACLMAGGPPPGAP